MQDVPKTRVALVIIAVQKKEEWMATKHGSGKESPELDRLLDENIVGAYGEL